MSSTIRIEKICEYCDASFIAKTSVTKFCSHDCGSKAYKAKKRNAKIEVAESHVIQVKLDAMNLLQAKEYLNISEACKVFGVSRRTIYRMIDKGEIHAAKLGSRTILRREDFDSLFDLREKVEVPKEKVFESYTVDEIEEKFRIKYSRLNVILNKTNIPKRVFNGRLHVSKPHIDSYFKVRRGDTDGIYTWYTVQEAQSKYGLSRDQVYHRVSENNIPKRREGKYVKISQQHFDELFKLQF